ncbi:MAG TPA: hypothetical protein VKZ50_19995 [bacterium]|nr:hypothetical protein [bacterium]
MTEEVGVVKSQQEMAELAMTEAQLRIVRSKLREWRKVQRRLERRARILRRVLGETRIVH